MRALLAALLLRANAPVTDDELAQTLWPQDAPATPRRAVQLLALRLRRALGPDGDRVERVRSGYALRVPAGALDLATAERLIADGDAALRAGRAQEARAMLDEALALWTGESLVEFADHRFFAEASRRIEDLRWHGFGSRNRAVLAQGGGTELIPDLLRAARAAPLREEPQRHLMLALYRDGRQAEALEVFRRLRATLIGELGVEPAPATKDLHLQILRQAPELAGRPPRVALMDRIREVELAQADVRAMVQDRIGALGGDAARVLAVAAREGLDLDPRSLATRIGRQEPDVRALLSAAAGAELVVETPGGAFAFAHPEVREATAAHRETG